MEREGDIAGKRQAERRRHHEQDGAQHDRRASQHDAELGAGEHEPGTARKEHAVLEAEANARPRPSEQDEQRRMDELVDGKDHDRGRDDDEHPQRPAAGTPAKTGLLPRTEGPRKPKPEAAGEGDDDKQAAQPEELLPHLPIIEEVDVANSSHVVSPSDSRP